MSERNHVPSLSELLKKQGTVNILASAEVSHSLKPLSMVIDELQQHISALIKIRSGKIERKSEINEVIELFTSTIRYLSFEFSLTKKGHKIGYLHIEDEKVKFALVILRRKVMADLKKVIHQDQKKSHRPFSQAAIEYIVWIDERLNDKIEFLGVEVPLADSDILITSPHIAFLHFIGKILSLFIDQINRKNDQVLRYGDFFCLFMNVSLSNQLVTDIQSAFEMLPAEVKEQVTKNEIASYLQWSKALKSKLKTFLHKMYETVNNSDAEKKEASEHILTNFLLHLHKYHKLNLLPLLGIFDYGDLWKALRVVNNLQTGISGGDTSHINLRDLVGDLLEEIGNEDILAEDENIATSLVTLCEGKDREINIEGRHSAVVQSLIDMFSKLPRVLDFESSENRPLLDGVTAVQCKREGSFIHLSFEFEQGKVLLIINTRTKKVDWNRIIPLASAELKETMSVVRLLDLADSLIRSVVNKNVLDQKRDNSVSLVTSKKGPRRDKNPFDFTTPITVSEELDTDELLDDSETGTSVEIIAMNVQESAALIPAGFSRERQQKYVKKLENINPFQCKKLDVSYMGRLCFGYRLSRTIRAILVALPGQAKGSLKTEVLLIDFRDKVYEEFKKKVEQSK